MIQEVELKVVVAVEGETKELRDQAVKAFRDFVRGAAGGKTTDAEWFKFQVVSAEVVK